MFRKREKSYKTMGYEIAYDSNTPTQPSLPQILDSDQNL